MSKLCVIFFCLFFGNTLALWQSYIDNQLVGTGFLSAGTILGNRDGSVWAKSGLVVSAAEGKTIIELFKNPGFVFSSGVTVGGIKYMGIKGDDRSIYGKKDAGGVVLVRTNQVIVIGVYGDKQQPGTAASAVERLADYLIDSGY